MRKTMTTADFKINPSRDNMTLHIHALLAGREMGQGVRVAIATLAKDFDYAFNLIISAVSYGLLRRSMVESEIRHLQCLILKQL